MKKRAGIARALMLEADLLFFDEPSAGLDPISAVELDQLILTLSRDLGITIVIVTHELPSIFLVADNCIVLDKAAKGIVARGDPRKLRDESEIPFVHNFLHAVVARQCPRIREGNPMAVEKSYARLGFFIVVAVVVVLATAVLFIQRMRSRAVIAMVTYTTENVSGLDVSSPVRYRGVPVGRVTDLRVDPRGTTRRNRLRGVPRPPQHHWLQCQTESEADYRYWRRISPPSGPDRGQPGNGRGVLIARCATKSPTSRWRLGSHRLGPTYLRCPRCLRRCRIGCLRVLDRAEATLQTLREIVGRIPDSLDRSDRFFTNVERIVQESQLPGAERRLAEILYHDKRADRAD